MTTESTKLPSRHQIGDVVELCFYNKLQNIPCKVEAVRFTESKVFYDLSINNPTSNEVASSNDSLLIQNVDSVYVKQLTPTAKDKA